MAPQDAALSWLWQCPKAESRA